MAPSRFSQQLIRKKMKERINIDLTNLAVRDSVQVEIKGNNVTIVFEPTRKDVNNADQAEIKEKAVRSSEAEA